MHTTEVKDPAKLVHENATGRPAKLLERIGSTTFEVTVHFSEKSKETMEDKILRMIEREVKRVA